MALDGEIRNVVELDENDRKRMFTLMDLHFEGMDESRFLRDLSEKEAVLVLRDRDGCIQGFSTAMTLDTELDGIAVKAVYSGDTIIHRDFWGEKTLGVLWLRYVLALQAAECGRRVYWFLISMGYKTYRLMRLFFKEYWPRHGRDTPSFEGRLIDHLGRLKFGDAYDPSRGIVSFGGVRERLRPGIADIDESRLKDRDIAFFNERNPGWRHGDELVCVAEIHPDNLRPSIHRVFGLENPAAGRHGDEPSAGPGGKGR